MTKEIQIVNRYFYPVLAGIETGIAETFSRFADRGWRVTVHTSQSTLTEENVLPTHDAYRGVMIKRYRLYHWAFFPKINWKSEGVIALRNFDLVPQGYLVIWAWVLKKLGRKHFTLVFTAHGGFTPDWNIFSLPVRLVKRAVHATIGTFFLNRVADGIQALSGLEKREFIAAGIRPELITVIPNGVPSEAFQDVDKLASESARNLVHERGTYLVQLCRVHPIKNCEAVIRALSHMAGVNYLIVGPAVDHEYKRSLQALAVQCGVRDRVRFTGEIRGIDKYFILKHAAMMVHMAHFEGYPNAILDGASQGLICVMSDHPSLKNLLDEGMQGYALPVRDEKMLAEKISSVLRRGDSKEIAEMRAINIEFAKRQSWERIAKRVEEWLANSEARSRK